MRKWNTGGNKLSRKPKLSTGYVPTSHLWVCFAFTTGSSTSEDWLTLLRGMINLLLGSQRFPLLMLVKSLTFLLFPQLRQPVLGNCVDDQFVVSGQNKNFLVPIICGINSGQHSDCHSHFQYKRLYFKSIFFSSVYRCWYGAWKATPNISCWEECCS